MKPKYIIALIVVVVFLVFGAFSLKKSLTPYVGFAQAQKGGTVQIIGQVVTGTDFYDTRTQKFAFTLTEEHGKEQMKVLYNGVKPGNFDQATEVVAIGQYQNGIFEADQLLVKCPSKYQGLEQTK
jgi:cytochrome c-type biogenesis protein CcmE